MPPPGGVPPGGPSASPQGFAPGGAAAPQRGGFPPGGPAPQGFPPGGPAPQGFAPEQGGPGAPQGGFPPPTFPPPPGGSGPQGGFAADPGAFPPPQAGSGPQSDTPPQSWTSYPAEPDPAGWQPRIQPTPRRPRRAVIAALAGGAVVALLLLSTVVYVVTRDPGDDTTGKQPSRTQASASAAPSVATSAYEGKFPAALRPFADSWLPRVRNCTRHDDSGGPTLGDGEVVRIYCQSSTMDVYFVQYASTEERDKARDRRLRQAGEAADKVPGLEAPAKRRTPSGNAEGDYLEYGFAVDDGRVFAGLWWDDTAKPVGGFIVANWKDQAGGSWAPVRDLWAQNA